MAISENVSERCEPMFDPDQAMEMIERLDFPRVCGSAGEAHAIGLLGEELNTLGVKMRYDWFEDSWIDPVDAFLVVGQATISVKPAVPLPWLPPESASIEASGTLVKPSESGGKREGLLAVRVEFNPSTVNLAGVSGQVLLFDPVSEFAPYALATDNPLPSAYVSQQGADKVLDSLGKKATLRWKARQFQRRFCNLVAEIPGSAHSGKVVVMGAHIDSWPGTVGSSDDAAGCAVVLEAVRWFVSHPPQRTVRCVWFTGEELDRRGSRHFVEDTKVKLGAVKLFINVDGGFEQESRTKPYIRVSPERMMTWVHSWLGEPGLQVRVAYASAADVKAFQDSNISTLWMTGGSRQPAHLPTDCPETIDRDRLMLIGRISLQAAEWAAQVGLEL